MFYQNGLETPVLRIKAKSSVTVNQGDGQHLTVNWDKSVKEEYFIKRDAPGVGRYWDTVEKVTEPRHLVVLLYQVLSAKPKHVFPLNQTLYGPPGTGKTFTFPALALASLVGKSLADIKGHYGTNQRALQQALAHYQTLGQTEFVTSHQAFGYEDFVEGINPTRKKTTNWATGLKMAYSSGCADRPGRLSRLLAMASRLRQP